MAKSFSPGTWVWYKSNQNSYWSYGQVSSYHAERNTYSVKVEGDPLRNVVVHAISEQVQPYTTGKYRKGARVEFTHPRSGFKAWGKVVRPTSPTCESYYVSLEGDPLRGLVMDKKDLR